MNAITKTWLAVVVLIIATGAGVLIWQRQHFRDQITQLETQLAQTETATADNTAQATENDAEATENSADEPETPPAVAYDPPGLFDDTLRQDFQTLIIEPLTMYQSDLGQPLAAVHIVPAQTEGEYVVTAIARDSSFSSFLTGSGGISWTPQCLDTCDFSARFEAAYPDIAAAARAGL